MAKSLVTISILLLAGFARAESPGDRALGILEQGLKDEKEEKRERAALALGLVISGEPARELAEAALSDPGASVRAAAATALGQIGLKASIPKLKEALKDKRRKSSSRRRPRSISGGTRWRTTSITRS